MSSSSNTEVYALSDVTNIDVPRLYEAGFQIATFDLDKTLVGQYEIELPNDRQELFRKFGEVGIKIALISNAHGPRISRVLAFSHHISECIGAA